MSSSYSIIYFIVITFDVGPHILFCNYVIFDIHSKISSARNFELEESSFNDIHQDPGRPDFASWYLIYGYVNGSATSCPNGISFSWL